MRWGIVSGDGETEYDEDDDPLSPKDRVKPLGVKLKRNHANAASLPLIRF